MQQPEQTPLGPRGGGSSADDGQSAGAPPQRASRRRMAVAAVGLLLALLLVSTVALAIGLAGGASDSEPRSGGGTAEAVTASDATDADSRTAGQAATASAVEVLAERAVIRTGAVSLVHDDVEAARRDVLAIVDALGGYVADEQSRADRDGRLRSADLTLLIPTDDLDTALGRLGGVGTVVGRSQSARDVTEQVVDIDSRVASAQASLRRVRLLLDRAESLGKVIRLEQVLSRRQADLESLLAQQESLAERTSLATVRVDIATPAAPRKDGPEPAGFLAGLARGWDALGTGYLVLATAVGAALPTVVVLGLGAVALRFLLHRFRGPVRLLRRPSS